MSDFFSLSKSSELKWRAKEVVIRIDGRPHLVVRLDISGAYFPHWSAEAFVRIAAGKERIVTCWFADVAGDSRRLSGYLPVDLPEKGTVEFGYGGQKLQRVPEHFESKNVERLVRERLPKDLIEVSSKYLRARLAPEKEG